MSEKNRSHLTIFKYIFTYISIVRRNNFVKMVKVEVVHVLNMDIYCCLLLVHIYVDMALFCLAETRQNARDKKLQRVKVDIFWLYCIIEIGGNKLLFHIKICISINITRSRSNVYMCNISLDILLIALLLLLCSDVCYHAKERRRSAHGQLVLLGQHNLRQLYSCFFFLLQFALCSLLLNMDFDLNNFVFKLRNAIFLQAEATKMRIIFQL